MILMGKITERKKGKEQKHRINNPLREHYKKLEQKTSTRDEVIKERIKELMEKGEAENRGISTVSERISNEIGRATEWRESPERIKKIIRDLPDYRRKIRDPNQPSIKIGLSGSKEEIEVSKNQKEILKRLQDKDLKKKSKSELARELSEEVDLKEVSIEEFLRKLDKKGYENLDRSEKERKRSKKLAKKAREENRVRTTVRHQEVIDLAEEIEEKSKSLHEAQKTISRATDYSKRAIYKILKDEAPRIHEKLKERGEKKRTTPKKAKETN